MFNVAEELKKIIIRTSRTLMLESYFHLFVLILIALYFTFSYFHYGYLCGQNVLAGLVFSLLLIIEVSFFAQKANIFKLHFDFKISSRAEVKHYIFHLIVALITTLSIVCVLSART